MPTIRELVEEAEENFGTGRHTNSAHLFKRAGFESLKRGAIDGLYLIYRTLYDYDKLSETEPDPQRDLSKLQTMAETATLLLELTKNEASNLVSERHDKSMELMQLMQKIMYLQHDDEGRAGMIKTIRTELMRLYERTGDDRHLKEILDLVPGDQEVINIMLEQLIDLIPGENENIQGSFNADLVLTAKLLEVLQLIGDKRTEKPYILKVQVIIDFVKRVANGDFGSTAEDVRHLILRYQVKWLEI